VLKNGAIIASFAVGVKKVKQKIYYYCGKCAKLIF
jgi:hypothetical protein